MAQPLFRWRMGRAAAGQGIYAGIARFGRERRDFVASVLEEVRSRGPLTAGELAAGARGEGGWWGWGEGQVGPRVPVLGRAGHHRHPPGLRAGLRPCPSVVAPGRFSICRRLIRRRRSANCCVAPPGPWASPPPAICATTSALDDGGCERVWPSWPRLGDLLPVAVEGWFEARLAGSGGTAAAANRGAVRCCRRSIRWSLSAREPSGCSTSATESRSTRPHTSETHGYYVLPFLFRDRLGGAGRSQKRPQGGLPAGSANTP